MISFSLIIRIKYKFFTLKEIKIWWNKFDILYWKYDWY